MSARFSLRRKYQPTAPSVPDDGAVGAYSGPAEAGYDGDPSAVYGPDPTDPRAFAPTAPVPEEEDDESWLAPDTRRRVKLAVPTFLLGALVVIAGAFWGGAEVDKHFGNHNTTSAAGLAAALGRRASATGAGGTGGGFAGLGGAGGGFAGGAFAGSTPTASGTLSAISGDDLTVTSTTGAKIRVVLTGSTIVTRTGEGSAGVLKVGDTVRVEGTKASNGTVTASSVTATAAGVSRGGGFAGLAGSGAGAAATASGGTPAAGSTTETTVRDGGFSGDGSGVSS